MPRRPRSLRPRSGESAIIWSSLHTNFGTTTRWSRTPIPRSPWMRPSMRTEVSRTSGARPLTSFRNSTNGMMNLKSSFVWRRTVTPK